MKTTLSAITPEDRAAFLYARIAALKVVLFRGSMGRGEGRHWRRDG